MLEVVQYHGKALVGLRCIRHTRGREPAQLVGEQILQNLSEEEGRQRNTDHDQNGHHVVSGGILVSSGSNAEGNGDEEFQDHGHEGDQEGHAHLFADDVDHGRTVLEARTEVKAHQLGQPIDVALEDTHKAIVLQAVELLHVVHGLLGNGGTALVHLSDLVFDKADGHTSDQHVNDERYAQQDEDRQSETFQNIL